MQTQHIINNQLVSSIAHIKPVPPIGTILWIGMVNNATPEHVVAEAANYGYTITVENVLVSWKQAGHLPETSTLHSNGE